LAYCFAIFPSPTATSGCFWTQGRDCLTACAGQNSRSCQPPPSTCLGTRMCGSSPSSRKGCPTTTPHVTRKSDMRRC